MESFVSRSPSPIWPTSIPMGQLSPGLSPLCLKPVCWDVPIPCSGSVMQTILAGPVPAKLQLLQSGMRGGCVPRRPDPGAPWGSSCSRMSQHEPVHQSVAGEPKQGADLAPRRQGQLLGTGQGARRDCFLGPRHTTQLPGGSCIQSQLHGTCEHLPMGAESHAEPGPPHRPQQLPQPRERPVGQQDETRPMRGTTWAMKTEVLQPSWRGLPRCQGEALALPLPVHSSMPGILCSLSNELVYPYGALHPAPSSGGTRSSPNLGSSSWVGQEHI
ncbi:uncharacterized protein LOC120384297 [Mauremys reevesii]|uniref:uncharacterized protein LOC120384297 n=1 Tax=Mauremys reevesii TaxID=260615 RepID=UPI00193F75D7|nr:uncharacterized protein LOC120384297 [Mauremys reevesii]